MKKTVKDTGNYIRSKTSRPATLEDINRPVPSVLDILSGIEAQITELLTKHRLEIEDHDSDMCKDILLEIEDARDHQAGNRINALGISCLHIGKLWEILRISVGSERIFKRLRRTIDKAKEPRGPSEFWAKAKKLFMDSERRGDKMTAGILYRKCFPKVNKAPISEESFSATYHRKDKSPAWRKELAGQ